LSSFFCTFSTNFSTNLTAFSANLTTRHSNAAVNLAALASLLLAVTLASPAASQSTPDIAHTLNVLVGGQGRLMWIDGTANLTRTIDVNGTATIQDYTTTQAGVVEIVRRCKAVHINTIVVDVRPLSGHALYNSKVLTHLREWRGRAVPDFDILAAFIAEGHKAGMQVDASINTLSEGHKKFGVGAAYDHPAWQSVVYTIDRGMVLPNGARLSVHAPNEPDDPDKPTLLSAGGTVQSDEPSGLTGLESTTSKNKMPGTETESSRQLNIVLDSDNRVSGVIDSALLGDDPLTAPEEGRLITATRDADRVWLSRNVKVGTPVHFDLRTALLPIVKAPSERVTCFVNALNPEVRRRILDVVRELTTNYAIDGLVLDRCRYSNINNDFSDLSRNTFAQFLQNYNPGSGKMLPQRTIVHWPQDIYSFPTAPGSEIVTGPLYKPWLEFRAGVIHDLVSDIARTAHSIKPQLVLGTYVGSWYPSYYEVGVNWGSDKTALRYSWFTHEYPRTGYAEFFDWISTGCYYPVATRADARRQGRSEKGTVEFAAGLSGQAIANGAFLYPAVYVPDYAEHPENLLKALDAAGRQGQGWMIFDLSHINELDMWSVLERAADRDAPSPDAFSGLIAEMRGAMDATR